MTLDDIFRIALEHFPMAHITEDLDGEVRIHTGLIMDRPLGGATGGPQNVQPDHRQFVELREMNEGDLPAVAV